MNNHENIIELNNVWKKFDKKQVLCGINLNVKKGEAIGLVGPNGAGKTTILSIIQGLKKPTSGTVKLFGDSPNNPIQRVGLGVSPQSISLPDTFKVGELVEFVRNHYPNRANFEDLIDEFSLNEIVNLKVGGLSGGQKRLVSMCLAFSGNPELVLLDEPTSGLDFQKRSLLWEIIKRKNKEGVAVIVTSHYLEEIKNLTERIIKIDNGRINIDDLLINLKDVPIRKSITLKTDHINEFIKLPSVEFYEIEGKRVSLKTTDSEKLLREIVMTKIHFEDLYISEQDLEGYFATNSQDVDNL